MTTTSTTASTIASTTDAEDPFDCFGGNSSSSSSSDGDGDGNGNGDSEGNDEGNDQGERRQRQKEETMTTTDGAAAAAAAANYSEQLLVDANLKLQHLQLVADQRAAAIHRLPLIRSSTSATGGELGYEVFDDHDHDPPASAPLPLPLPLPSHRPSRGKGLRARRPYICGDEILREGAVLRIPNRQAATSFEEAQTQHAHAVQQAFQALSEATRDAVQELSCATTTTTTTTTTTNSTVVHTNNNKKKNDNDDDDDDDDHEEEEEDGGTMTDSVVGVVSSSPTPQGIYDTNAFQLTGGESDGAMFLTVARINHSCRPNSNHCWRPDLQQMLVFASTDIAIGEELCTFYGPAGECLDTAGRRAYLHERFFFHCLCGMCVEGKDKGGDDRMRAIQTLQDQLAFSMSTLSSSSSSSSNSSPFASDANKKYPTILGKIDQCLELLNEQGLGAGVFTKPLLHWGYQVCAAAAAAAATAMTTMTTTTTTNKNWDAAGLARSYLERELEAVQVSEGMGCPKAIEIEQELGFME